jgi:hypothetical protein
MAREFTINKVAPHVPQLTKEILAEIEALSKDIKE